DARGGRVRRRLRESLSREDHADRHRQGLLGWSGLRDDPHGGPAAAHGAGGTLPRRVARGGPRGARRQGADAQRGRPLGGAAVRALAGRNTGKLTSGVTSSKPTSTGMPISIACGARPVTVESIRGPSTSWITTTAYGTRAANHGWLAWCMTAMLKTCPVP